MFSFHCQRGILSVADELLHIEPLKEHHAKRMKRGSSEDAVKLHIIYKRSPSTDDVTSCPVEPCKPSKHLLFT